MSTKAIEEALDKGVRCRCDELRDGDEECDGCRRREAAQADLAAIREAARALDANLPALVFASRPIEVEGALAIIGAIAKEGAEG